MKISPLNSYNQNIQFKQTRYYLNNLVKYYNKLPEQEIKYLKENNIALETLKDFYKLNGKWRCTTLGTINGHKMLERCDHSLFEIGKTCKLLLDVFFRGIRMRSKTLEFVSGDTSQREVDRAFEKIIEDYKEMMKNPEGGNEENYYKSKTLDKLYSPKYKVEPQKTEEGYYSTTIINKKTEEPEKVYIKIDDNPKISRSSNIYLLKDTDSEHPQTVHLGSTDRDYSKIILGTLSFDCKNGNFTDAYIYNGHYSDEYSGIGFRLIQALIEYSLQKNANITINSAPESLPFFTKAGFRVNPKKDELVEDDGPFFAKIFGDIKGYGIPKKQFKSALKKISRNGMTGYGKNDMLETFNRLLYHKNKHIFYPCYSINFLELTPKTAKEWFERIKLQPMFPQAQDLIEKGII